MAYKFEVVTDKYRKHPLNEIQLPARATKNACAYDFYAPSDCHLFAHSSLMIWTDVKAVIPSKYMLMLNVRSSFGKANIRLANTQGWVDADYASNPDNDGNIGIYLRNDSDEDFPIRRGDRIAQGMIVKYYTMEDDAATATRAGGFGSTGK